MRYYNYLNEDIDNLLKNNQLFELFKKNEHMLLYRGAKRDIYNYQINKSITNRTPKDMPLVLHNLFDNAFQKKFGWKARSEGVFATGDKYATADYGQRYIFIPIEPYKFIYSTKIVDLFTDVTEFQGKYLKTKEIDVIQSYIKDESPYFEKDVENIITQIINSYTDNDIIKAIKSKNEIIFKCNQYILMEKKYFEDNYYEGI